MMGCGGARGQRSVSLAALGDSPEADAIRQIVDQIEKPEALKATTATALNQGNETYLAVDTSAGEVTYTLRLAAETLGNAVWVNHIAGSNNLIVQAQSGEVIKTVRNPTGANTLNLKRIGEGVLLNSDGTSNLAMSTGGDVQGACIPSDDTNTVLGKDAGCALTTGANNVLIGHDAGDAVTTGSANVCVGKEAGSSITTTNNNIAIGNAALRDLSSGTDNIAIGLSAADVMTTGSGNTAVGAGALGDTGTKSNNTAIGKSSCANLETGGDNVAVGHLSLQLATTGGDNAAVGVQALKRVTTGSGNVGLGHDAGPTANQSNRLYIHNAESDSPLIGGNFSTPCAGINNGDPKGGGLHIHVGTVTSEPTYVTNDGLIVAKDAEPVIQIQSANTSLGHLVFSDPDDRNVASIKYDHSANKFTFRTNAGDRVYIDSSGNVGINASSPGSLLELGFSTENLELVDAGSASATEQDWIEVQVGNNTGYLRVFASK